MPASDEQTLEQGQALREAAQLEESRSVLEHVVVQRIRDEGRKGFSAQCAISQLARTLRQMGRAEQAAGLHWEVMATRLELYGRCSGFTQNSANILTDTLRAFLHDDYMAAAVEAWSAEPQQPGETIGMSLTPNELQQMIRQHESDVARCISQLIQEYLHRPLANRTKYLKPNCVLRT
jgi:hypothetical protein